MINLAARFRKRPKSSPLSEDAEMERGAANEQPLEQSKQPLEHSSRRHTSPGQQCRRAHRLVLRLDTPRRVAGAPEEQLIQMKSLR